MPCPGCMDKAEMLCSALHSNQGTQSCTALWCSCLWNSLFSLTSVPRPISHQFSWISSTI